MWMNPHLLRQLREQEIERSRRRHESGRPGRPLMRPLVHVAGRALRRAGEGLESWASAAPRRETVAARRGR